MTHAEPLTAEEVAKLRSDLARVIQPERSLLRLIATLDAIAEQADDLIEAVAHCVTCGETSVDACDRHRDQYAAWKATYLAARTPPPGPR